MCSTTGAVRLWLTDPNTRSLTFVTAQRIYYSEYSAGWFCATLVHFNAITRASERGRREDRRRRREERGGGKNSPPRTKRKMRGREESKDFRRDHRSRLGSCFRLYSRIPFIAEVSKEWIVQSETAWQVLPHSLDVPVFFLVFFCFFFGLRDLLVSTQRDSGLYIDTLTKPKAPTGKLRI